MADQTRAPTPSQTTVTVVESEDESQQVCDSTHYFHCLFFVPQVLISLREICFVFWNSFFAFINECIINIRFYYNWIPVAIIMAFLNFRRQYNLFHSGRKLSSVFASYSTLKGPLDGIRVLDLTRIVAGPFCSMILGDLGAEVLKIERPGVGDEARNWGPPFVEGTKESCYFLSLNRNKKSVCVNIKSREGREIIHDLSKKCDVLIENYVPGKLDEIGLGYEDLKQIAPQLVYCSMTGYGSHGLYSNRPGYDVIAASVGGLLHITGPPGGEPCKAGVAMTDIATGLYAHGAILAALLQRTRTQRGQKIDCNLLSTQIACLINVGSNYLNSGREASRMGTQHGSIVPYQAFKTSDNSFVTVGAGSDQQFRDLCERLGLTELSSDPLFSSNRERVRNREILLEKLKAHFQSKSLAQWLDILEGAPFPYGPVNSMSQVFNDPHVKEIKLVKEVDHPVGQTIKVVGPPVEYSDAENSVRLPPPLLGQHTSEVLRSVLQYSDDKINFLKQKQVIQ